MTDKATVEVPGPMAGTVVAITGEVGEKRPVGSELVVLEVAGEGNAAAVSQPVSAPPGARPAEPLTPALSPQAGRGRGEQALRRVPSPRARGEGQGEGQGRAQPPVNLRAPSPRRPGEKPLASPAVRRRAWDLGIPLHFVAGTGPGGRITRED